MNYKEKYRKALERARYYHSKDYMLINSAIENIFPELNEKESKDERIRKAIHIYLDWLDDRKDYAPKGSYSIKDMVAWLEKQGEDKHTDKVEPKFKVGKWITNGDYIWKIVEVTPLDYILQSQDGDIADDTISYVDEQFHSFTIEDAKDGDVLYAKGGHFYFKEYVFKFSSFTEDNVISTHFGYDIFHGTFDTKLSRFGREEDFVFVNPATKEQRDLLFHKMKEAGYEWDSEKKELKKIKIKKKGDKNE